MSIEVGQWYRCRDEKLLANVIGKVFDDDLPFVIAYYKAGKVASVARVNSAGVCGWILNNIGDLVERLPDCTGPNWKPKKWRPVTVEDLKDGVQRARFRNFSTDVWIESHLRGVRWKGTTLEWHYSLEDRYWLYCEVLDD